MQKIVIKSENILHNNFHMNIKAISKCFGKIFCFIFLMVAKEDFFSSQGHIKIFYFK